MGDIIYHIDGNGVNFHVNGNLNDTTTLGNTTTYDGTITNENTLDVATPIIKDHVFLNNSVNLDTGDCGGITVPPHLIVVTVPVHSILLSIKFTQG